jgi:hypothetical protein
MCRHRSTPHCISDATLQATQLHDLLRYVLARPARHPQPIEVFVGATLPVLQTEEEYS